MNKHECVVTEGPVLMNFVIPFKGHTGMVESTGPESLYDTAHARPTVVMNVSMSVDPVRTLRNRVASLMMSVLPLGTEAP